MIETEGIRVKDKDGVYSFSKPKTERVTLRAVPYYLWGNRGENEMRVWIPEE